VRKLALGVCRIRARRSLHGRHARRVYFNRDCERRHSLKPNRLLSAPCSLEEWSLRILSSLSDLIGGHACAEHYTGISSGQCRVKGRGKVHWLRVFLNTFMESSQPGRTIIIDMIAWNWAQKSHPNWIQAAINCNKQGKPCLCRSHWSCRLMRRSWPPNCWDSRFDSRFGHGCLSLPLYVCCLKQRPCKELITYPRSPATCAPEINVMEKAWALQ
jgi:hypothetical protein